MTSLDLDAIEARADAATPGPWTTGADKEWSDALAPWTLILSADYPLTELAKGPQGTADAEFIARARTDVPALIAEVDRLREQIYAQKPVIDAVNTWAEAHEDGDHEATIRATADLYGAVEEYRLMDAALTTARNEQPEAAR